MGRPVDVRTIFVEVLRTSSGRNLPEWELHRRTAFCSTSTFTEHHSTFVSKAKNEKEFIILRNSFLHMKK